HGSRSVDRPRGLAHTPRMSKPALFSIATALCLAACSTNPPHATAPTAPAAAAPAATLVPERYVSVDSPGDELDSLATWPAEDGSTWLIATAKASHALVVFDADSGERLRAFGRKGGGRGELLRPNGIAVQGNHLFVAERDNH